MTTTDDRPAATDAATPEPSVAPRGGRLRPEYAELLARLTTRIDDERCHTDLADRLAYGTDASFYRLIPQIVVETASVDEVAFILREAGALGLPVTFRGAGTSLSGQAITDSVLVLALHNWTGLEVLDDGDRVRLQPGVIGRIANAALLPYQRKIGPDPASINAAAIGGIVANNASGMCCGTKENSYQTLSSITIVFADGTVLDSGDPESVAAFERDRADLVEAVDALARATKADTALADRIRRKFAVKNTMGYSLNALIDFDDPIDVITHLMVGSEGTLGFLGEIVYDTVLEEPHKASALVMFPDIGAACDAVTALESQPVAAVELMDRASLRSVQDKPGVPDYLPDLAPEVAALLVEARGMTVEELTANIDAATAAIETVPLERPFEFSADPALFSVYWNIRKGLFPAVGAVRRIGTTVIIEDVTFPIDRLAQATLDLQDLFRRHGYTEAVIFGHALAGNLHFVFTQDFDDPTEVARYDGFIRELTELVVGRYDGALKAEHGTGRNMAPFVEYEWGTQAVELMRRIKATFDPDGLLNPGVIFNDDPNAHLADLKPLPPADPIVDVCIECGFCESSCISHGLTYSPRQRIVLQREIARLRTAGRTAEADEMHESIHYGFDDTCSTDGLCAIACPVDIDTGKYVKRFRAEARSDSRVAGKVAEHYGAVSSVVKVALRAGRLGAGVIGAERMDKLASTVTGWVGDTTHWDPGMPPPARRQEIGDQPSGDGVMKVVYFSSCVNRIFGPSPDDPGEPGVFARVVSILHKANCEIVTVDDSSDQCCGLAFSSQGFTEAGTAAQSRLGERLLEASNGGEYPIVCDMSPCTHSARDGLADLGLPIHDLIDFTTTYLLDRLEFEQADGVVELFPVCSVKKMGLVGDLQKIGLLCSSEIHVADTNCCGFAGNRGFMFPELNAWGLRDLDDQIPDDVSGSYSTSRTCEIGLSTHSAERFDSLVKLIDEHTTPKKG